MNRRRTRWIGYGLIAGALAAILFFQWPGWCILEIHRAGNSGDVVLCARMYSGEEFTLSFTHSVNRRPVEDTLRVEGDHLVIVRSRFDAFGAGMPESSTIEGTLTVEKDGRLIWEVNRVTPNITVRVGRVSDHILTIKGQQIHLSDLAEGGAGLTFQVRLAHMPEIMKGRCVS